MTWTVLKLGGTSVSVAGNWDRVGGELCSRLARGEHVLVVQSALTGVTDLLERLLATPGAAEREALLGELDARHRRLADEMRVDVERLAPRRERLALLALGAALTGEVTPRVRAEVLAQGELLASELGAAYLAELDLPVEWCDARELLVSTPAPNQSERAAYLSAVCDPEPDSALRARLGAGAPLVLTQGFIARNPAGDTVVLGRGGSDTSGAYLAAKLEAELYEVWTDVPGMYTADPRLVDQARLLKALDYDEAQELASTGARVLHPRCIEPVRRRQIPLVIRCTPDPGAPGTTVGPRGGDGDGRVKAISVLKGVTLVSMETVGMWQQVGFLADAFACFKRQGLSVDLVSTSETCVTASLDEAANAATPAKLERLTAELSAICRPSVIRGCAAVSVVGRRMRANLHRLAPALELFEEREVYLVSQAANDLNFTFVVEEPAAERAAKALHALLIPQGADDATFGPRWNAGCAAERARAPWWLVRREELLELAGKASPRYVYSAEALRAAVAELRGLSAVDRLLYAVKANPHAEVLRVLHAAGVGFECVSPGELLRAREAVPHGTPGELLFTPNFAPRHEYREALAGGVTVTLDNLHCLEHWGADFSGARVFLRLDPGHGAGHHRHVHTGGTLSKFGIPLDELERALELVRAHEVSVIGLHAHLGSGILDADAWRDAGARLLEAARHFSELRVLDLGGGFGIPERPEVEGLDLARLDAGLWELRRERPDLELWLEPGRFLVARAGVLLARVTQTKAKGSERYVGVDAGMNSLVRPALYGAHHEIVNLTRLDTPPSETATVVGPICESGDVLGRDRRLPPCAEGDVLLVADAGAYGASMASRYNLREPAQETLLD